MPEFVSKHRLYTQVQSLLHVLCDETELAELELKVCHCTRNISFRITVSRKLFWTTPLY